VRAITFQRLEREARVLIEERGYARGTAKNWLYLLRAALAYGHRSLGLPPPPAMPQIRVKNARQGFFEREEFEALVQYAAPEAADVLRFGFLTGWRLSECVGLTWDRVDLGRAEIRLEDSKTDEGRVRPVLEDELLDLLRRRARLRVPGLPWVFHRPARWTGTRGQVCPPGWRGQPVPVRDKWLWGEFNKAHQKARLPDRVFHDFRRSAYRDFVESGVDLKTAAELIGHKSIAIALRYNIVETKRLKRGLELVARWRREQQQGHTPPQTAAEARGPAGDPDNIRTIRPRGGPRKLKNQRDA
jgi:integrase